MRAGDAEFPLEDEGRHRGDAQAPHVLLERGHALGVRLSGPARHPNAYGDAVKHSGIADVARLLEIGTKEPLDHLLPLPCDCARSINWCAAVVFGVRAMRSKAKAMPSPRPSAATRSSRLRARSAEPNLALRYSARAMPPDLRLHLTVEERQ